MADKLVYSYRYILSVLGYSAKPLISINKNPAVLINNDTKQRTNLNEILDSCASLKGDKAFYTPTFWLTR